jgi:CheY-like chemotaxis protein
LIKNIIQQFIPKPHILEAKTGLEAIEKIKTNNIDLVFMDIQMPELDGISAVIEIRKFDKKIPIIALTAGAVTEEKEKSLKAGMNGFITKPININQIKENLENYLKKNPPI